MKLNFAVEFAEDMEEREKKTKMSIKKALLDAVAWYQTEGITGHFKPGADSLYGYRPRNKKYQAQKDKRGLPPLVWKGKSMRFIKNKSFQKQSFTFSAMSGGEKRATFQATGKWQGLEGAIPYFLIKPRSDSNRPDLVSELMTTTTEDEMAIYDKFVERYQYHINTASGTKHTKRVKV